jgi:hypothetical protein
MSFPARIVFVAALASASFVHPQNPSHLQHARGGTLVVWLVSNAKDYVVIGAESRNIGLPSGKTIDDRSCKIIQLGQQTVFFELGLSTGQRSDGEIWSPQKLAGTVYDSVPQRDAVALSVMWGKAAMEWLLNLLPDDLAAATQNEGRLTLGGFVNFGDAAPIEMSELFYNIAERKLYKKQTPFVRHGMVGVGTELVEEFGTRSSFRASQAHKPSTSVGVDPHEDAETVRASIQFAIDNSVGVEHDKIGGPIDVAIVRPNQKVEWVSRKSRCYALDDPPGKPPSPPAQGKSKNSVPKPK